jgi:hypothetical protein
VEVVKASISVLATMSHTKFEIIIILGSLRGTASLTIGRGRAPEISVQQIATRRIRHRHGLLSTRRAATPPARLDDSWTEIPRSDCLVRKIAVLAGRNHV